MNQIRLHVIPMTNQEKDAAGNFLQPYQVTPQEFAQLIDRVNGFYRDTNIQFLFDPVFDWAPMANTEINTDGANQRKLCNEIAAAIPGKMVCFLRWGGDPAGPTGNGNAYPPPGAGTKPPHVSDVEQNYVMLPNRIAANFGLLNQGNGSFVSHEFGHYLGLYHTFPGWTSRWGPVYGHIKKEDWSLQAADQAVIDYIAANGGTIQALNGDGLSDTAPDPMPELYTIHNQDICANQSITVNGKLNRKAVSFTFTPDPNNIMSYFGGCQNAAPFDSFHFSAQQIKLMNDTLKHASRRHLVESPKFGTRSLQFRSAVARKSDRIEVVAADVDGRAWFAHWSPTTPGGNWNRWRPIISDIAPPNAQVSVVSRDANRLDVFTTGSDGKTYTAAWDQNISNGQWRGWWNILSGFIPAGGAVTAVSRTPNSLDVFIVSNDGGIYTAAWDQNIANAQWRGWSRIGAVTAKPGSLVTAVKRDANKLDIFVAGNDGKTYTAAWDSNVANGQWRGWWNILNGFVPAGGAVTAISRTPNSLDVFLVSNDGGIYTAAWDQNIANAQWRGWARIGTLTAKAGSQVAVVARDANKLDIFVAGSDGKTYSAAWDANVAGGQWRGWWNILGGAIAPGSAVAALSRTPNSLDVFIVSSDGGIYTAAWDQNLANAQWRGWWRIGA